MIHIKYPFVVIDTRKPGFLWANFKFNKGNAQKDPNNFAVQHGETVKKLQKFGGQPITEGVIFQPFNRLKKDVKIGIHIFFAVRIVFNFFFYNLIYFNGVNLN